MFHNLLVAYDGSGASLRGLKAGLALALDQDAALHVVYVVEPSSVARTYDGEIYLPQSYVDAALEALQETGRNVLAKAERLAARRGEAVRTHLVAAPGGTVADAILRTAKKVQADLIVVGTHGRRGLRRALMGSDAEAVLREALVPVLVVRAEPRDMLRAAKDAMKRGTKASRVEVVALGSTYP